MRGVWALVLVLIGVGTKPVTAFDQLIVSENFGDWDPVVGACYHDSSDIYCRGTGKHALTEELRDATELVLRRMRSWIADDWLLCGVRWGRVACRGRSILVPPKLEPHPSNARHSFALGENLCWVEGGRQRCFNLRGGEVTGPLKASNLRKVVRARRSPGAGATPFVERFCGMTDDTIHCANEHGGDPLEMKVSGLQDVAVGGEYVCATHEGKVTCWGKQGALDLPGIENPVAIKGTHWSGMYYGGIGVFILHGRDPNARYISFLGLEGNVVKRRAEFRLDRGVKEMSLTEDPLCAIDNADGVWCMFEHPTVYRAQFLGRPDGTNPRFLPSPNNQHTCVKWDQGVDCLDYRWGGPSEPKSILQEYLPADLVAIVGSASPRATTCAIGESGVIRCFGDNFSMPSDAFDGAVGLDLSSTHLLVARVGAMDTLYLGSGALRRLEKNFQGVPRLAQVLDGHEYRLVDDSGLWNVLDYGRTISQEKWFALPLRDERWGARKSVRVLGTRSTKWGCAQYEREVVCQSGSDGRVVELKVGSTIEMQAQAEFLCISKSGSIECFNDELSSVGRATGHWLRPQFGLARKEGSNAYSLLFVMEENLLKWTRLPQFNPFMKYGESVAGVKPLGPDFQATKRTDEIVRWLARVGRPADERFLRLASLLAPSESVEIYLALKMFLSEALDHGEFVVDVKEAFAGLERLALASGKSSLSEISRTPQALASILGLLRAAVDSDRFLLTATALRQWTPLSERLAEIEKSGGDVVAVRAAVLPLESELRAFLGKLNSHPFLKGRAQVAISCLEFVLN